MKIAVIGAGAMGGSYGGLMAAAGADVRLIDSWAEHVAAIRADGLRVDGALGDRTVRLPAAEAPEPGETADVAIVFTDTNNTRAAAETAAGLLAPGGFAVTFQNGVGNVETLQEVLGSERVLGGSSMCSAACIGPGHVRLTHLRATAIGEIDGVARPRADALVRALEAAGLPVERAPDIMGRIWQKFVVNCATNALAATTGLRPGEFARLPETAAFQARLLDEAMAVIDAKGVALPNPGVAGAVRAGARKSFNLPSMLQHVRAGRRTEIDSLNGALVREAHALGVPVPANEALLALLKGRELAQMRAVREPDLDYDAWEARVAADAE